MSGTVDPPPGSSKHTALSAQRGARGSVNPAAAAGGRGAALSLGSGASSQLKTGETVTLRIVQRLAGGQWQVSLSGKLLTVTADVPLQAGAVMRAVVETTAGSLFLRLIPDSLPARLAQALGLPETRELRLAVDALARSNMALSSEQVTSLLKALVRLRRQDAGSARVLALLHDRGLRLTSDQVEELLMALEGVPGWAGDAGGGQSRDDRDSDRRQEEDESRQVRPAPAGVRDAVGGALRFFCGRTTEIGDHLLQLFNHLPPLHDRWVVIPFGYSLAEGGGAHPKEEMSVNGSLRLRIATKSPGASRPEADLVRLSVRCGGSSWLFGWSLHSGRQEIRRMEIHTDAEPGRGSLRELFATVRRLGFIPSESPLSLSDSDGFSAGDAAPPASGVNETL